MIVTILGSGTSTGVPIIQCKCTVCRSRNPKNKRLRASVWIQLRHNGVQKSLLIDTSTDLRQQALRANIKDVDAVLYTHPHADHISGIDELRCYNFWSHKTIPVYGNAWTCKELVQKFEYIFKPGPVEGGGIPQLALNQFDSSVPALDVAGVQVIPISVQHGSKECIGYRVGTVAYVTDCSYIPDHSKERLKGLSTLILDCVRVEKHRTHLNVEEAVALAQEFGAKQTYLTHLGHDFDHVRWSRKLPKGIALAYDGLQIKTKEHSS